MKNCIVRDLDTPHKTTAPMDCVKAMTIAKSGKWSKNWSVEECLVNPEGSAPILKEWISFKDGKLHTQE
ncbi:MAG: hypothetical protein QM500_09170 [Methylococcales bacterium]